jgi:hypothetical protein
MLSISCLFYLPSFFFISIHITCLWYQLSLFTNNICLAWSCLQGQRPRQVILFRHCIDKLPKPPCPVNPTWPGSRGQVTPSANRINTFLQGYSHQAMSLYYKIRFRIPSDFINGKKKINKLRPINYYTTTSKEKWNRNFLWSFNLKFLIHQWHILILQGFNLCGQTRKNWITFDTNCRYLILHFQG